MTFRTPPQCVACAHFRSPLDTDGGGPEQTCDVFPDRIPDAIWWNRADHRQPYAGDGGVRWEPRDAGAVFPDWAVANPSDSV